MPLSRPVHSAQCAIHSRLVERVERHLANRWLQPIHAASRDAFQEFLHWHDPERPLILDSGCGTGASTLRLAQSDSAAQVLGIDQSLHRLGRGIEVLPESVLLVRARLQDVWRLLLEHQIGVDQHWLLYPNPWPKARHLGKRWHGHPVFPELLRLGPLELRCNWRVYADEFAAAARVCGAQTSAVVSFRPDLPLSPFEAKYANSGHELYRLECNLEKNHED